MSGTMRCPACVGGDSAGCGMCKGHGTVGIVSRGMPEWLAFWEARDAEWNRTHSAEGLADSRAETDR